MSNETGNIERMNSTDDDISLSAQQGALQHGLLVMLGLSILVINAWALAAIGRTRALHTASNIYVASLASTDLLVGVSVTFSEVGEIVGLTKLLKENRLACLGAIFFATVSILSSKCTLAVIAVDRYLYISRPFFYRRMVTKTRVGLSMLPVWGTAVSLAVAMGVLKSQDKNVVCGSGISAKTDVYIAGTVYFICCVVSATVYFLISRIAWKLWKRTPRPSARQDGKSTQMSSGSVSDQNPETQISGHRIQSVSATLAEESVISNEHTETYSRTGESAAAYTMSEIPNQQPETDRTIPLVRFEVNQNIPAVVIEANPAISGVGITAHSFTAAVEFNPLMLPPPSAQLRGGRCEHERVKPPRPVSAVEIGANSANFGPHQNVPLMETGSHPAMSKVEFGADAVISSTMFESHPGRSAMETTAPLVSSVSRQTISAVDSTPVKPTISGLELGAYPAISDVESENNQATSAEISNPPKSHPDDSVPKALPNVRFPIGNRTSGRAFGTEELKPNPKPKPEEVKPKKSSTKSDYRKQLCYRLRTTKMFVIVFGSFFICTTPLIVSQTLQALDVQVPFNVHKAFMFLSVLNSLINVPLYLSMNANFRRAFVKTCKCCCGE